MLNAFQSRVSALRVLRQEAFGTLVTGLDEGFYNYYRLHSGFTGVVKGGLTDRFKRIAPFGEREHVVSRDQRFCDLHRRIGVVLASAGEEVDDPLPGATASSDILDGFGEEILDTSKRQ